MMLPNAKKIIANMRTYSQGQVSLLTNMLFSGKVPLQIVEYNICELHAKKIY